MQKGILGVKLYKGQMKSNFVGGSETTVKTFNQKVYALDNIGNMLHAFDVNQAMWNSTPFATLKLPN